MTEQELAKMLHEMMCPMPLKAYDMTCVMARLEAYRSVCKQKHVFHIELRLEL
jgi:hypothetical protein